MQQARTRAASASRARPPPGGGSMTSAPQRSTNVKNSLQSSSTRSKSNPRKGGDSDAGSDFHTASQLAASKVVLNASLCRYDILRECCLELGWFVDENSEFKYDDFNVLWLDTSVAPERVMRLSGYQRINHFPGMSEISSKTLMSRNLNRMKSRFPKEYSFYPTSFSIPAEITELSLHMDAHPDTMFICKPQRGCQGKGIFLTNQFSEIKPLEGHVVQEYVNEPLLFDGYKFDLRLYVLVMDCDPLRIYLHRDGMARLCTTKYKKPTNKNKSHAFMHLTNYAINKKNSDCVANDVDEDGEEIGFKRSLHALRLYLGENGYSATQIWCDIHDLVVKTIIAIQPILAHTLRSCQPDSLNGKVCFEVLGFDILLDKRGKPWLLEVNHSPSFSHDTELDHTLKCQVITETLRMLRLTPRDRDRYQRKQRRVSQRRMQGESQSSSYGNSNGAKTARSRTESSAPGVIPADFRQNDASSSSSPYFASVPFAETEFLNKVRDLRLQPERPSTPKETMDQGPPHADRYAIRPESSPGSTVLFMNGQAIHSPLDGRFTFGGSRLSGPEVRSEYGDHASNGMYGTETMALNSRCSSRASQFRKSVSDGDVSQRRTGIQYPNLDGGESARGLDGTAPIDSSGDEDEPTCLGGPISTIVQHDGGKSTNLKVNPMISKFSVAFLHTTLLSTLQNFTSSSYTDGNDGAHPSTEHDPPGEPAFNDIPIDAKQRRMLIAVKRQMEHELSCGTRFELAFPCCDPKRMLRYRQMLTFAGECHRTQDGRMLTVDIQPSASAMYFGNRVKGPNASAPVPLKSRVAGVGSVTVSNTMTSLAPFSGAHPSSLLRPVAVKSSTRSNSSYTSTCPCTTSDDKRVPVFTGADDGRSVLIDATGIGTSLLSKSHVNERAEEESTSKSLRNHFGPAAIRGTVHTHTGIPPEPPRLLSGVEVSLSRPQSRSTLSSFIRDILSAPDVRRSQTVRSPTPPLISSSNPSTLCSDSGIRGQSPINGRGRVTPSQELAADPNLIRVPVPSGQQGSMVMTREDFFSRILKTGGSYVPSVGLGVADSAAGPGLDDGISHGGHPMPKALTKSDSLGIASDPALDPCDTPNADGTAHRLHRSILGNNDQPPIPRSAVGHQIREFPMKPAVVSQGHRVLSKLPTVASVPGTSSSRTSSTSAKPRDPNTNTKVYRSGTRRSHSLASSLKPHSESFPDSKFSATLIANNLSRVPSRSIVNVVFDVEENDSNSIRSMGGKPGLLRRGSSSQIVT